MKFILLSWLFITACNNPQPKPLSNETEPVVSSISDTTPLVVEKKLVEPKSKPTKKEMNKQPVSVDKPKEEKKLPKVKETTLPPIEQPTKEMKKEVLISNATWDALLQKYVSNDGKVNYSGFKKEEPTLDSYLDYLSNNVPNKSTKRKAQMAFWINAYNAFTIKLILKNYPVKSIMDINGGKAWDLKFIKLGGKTYTLNQIEHGILRPTFKDARIHFAVNCAAKSCPPIYNHAWTAENLEATLEQRAKAFINDPKFNSISAKKVKLSNIFNWYKDDFGNIIAFLNKYSTTKVDAHAKVSYIDYNWALNK